MISGKRQSARTSFWRAAGAALPLALAVLPGCSDVALPREDMPGAEANTSYNGLVANYLRVTFKDRASYNAFEMSGSRWVHSVKGWNWLVCVRFQDHGHHRTYALFIKDNAVVDGRYAVQTDGCDAETYSPFDLGGTMRPAGAGVREPLY